MLISHAILTGCESETWRRGIAAGSVIYRAEVRRCETIQTKKAKLLWKVRATDLMALLFSCLFRWTVVTPMSSNRSAAGVTVFEGRIYVSGGHDGLQIFSSVSLASPG